MKSHDRHIIYANDIMIITGRSKSYAYDLLRRIKEFYNKAMHQLVTVEEFAKFVGMPISRVMEYLR